MNETDKLYRASEARRLLDEPLLREALDAMETRALEGLLQMRGADPEADRGRRALVDYVNVIRNVRADLRHVIAEGKVADETRQYWA